MIPSKDERLWCCSFAAESTDLIFGNALVVSGRAIASVLHDYFGCRYLQHTEMRQRGSAYDRHFRCLIIFRRFSSEFLLLKAVKKA
jgi:hypothetical protein